MNQNTSIYIISGKNPLISKSGYASYSYNLATILTSLGYRVEIFCFGKKDELLNTKIGTVNIVGSKLYSTLLKDTAMAGLFFLAPKLAIALKTVIASESKQSSISNQPLIIWGIGPWSLTGAFIKFLKGNRVIFLSDYFTTIQHEFLGTLSGITIKDHGIWNKLQSVIAYLTIIPLYSLLEYFLLKSSNKIITHYQSTENILTSQFNISSKKYVRLPYYVELASPGWSSRAQQQPSPSQTPPLILLISRHDGRKGINFLLHAFSILNQRGVSYKAAIIGGGKLFKTHQSLVQKLKLKNVHLLGNIQNLQPFFKKSYLFVFPSLEEGSSSLAILEAMKEGLPIVSTNVDGIPEDLTHNKSAILVPSKDPQVLADAMQKLLQDPPLAKKLGQNARKAYLKKYNLDIVREQIGEFLHSLVKRSHQ